MNVLIVTAMFPPIRTGTSFYARNLANALAGRGHAVTVVTVTNAEPDTETHAYPVHRIPSFRFPFSFFKHFRITAFSPLNYQRVHRIARESRADVVLLINHYLDIAFPAIRAAQGCGIPIACSVGTQLQSSVPWREHAMNALDRLICGRLIFPCCDRLIAWDKEILRYLTHVHGPSIVPKCTIINYGVNGDPFVLLSHAHDYDSQHQILGVGSVVHQRSYVPLVRAFHAVSSEFPRAQLKIVGHIYVDTAVTLARELGIADRVVFTGEMSHDAVLREFERSDLYYVSLTARYAGLGTGTTEAMLMGVPVIANVPADILGTAVLGDGEHFVSAGDDSVASLADKLRLVLRDRALRARVGAGGRAFIREHMTWEKIAREMETLFQQLVAERSRSEALTSPAR